MFSFYAPGSGTFQGQGTMDPQATATGPAQLATPAANSGLQLSPGQQAAHALNRQLVPVVDRLAWLLQGGVPGAIRDRALRAVDLVNAIQRGYTETLANNRSAAWDRPGVRQQLQQYRIALDQVGQAAQILQALAQGQVPTGSGQLLQLPRVSWPGAQQGMGVWSWNPNYWFKTEEEVRAMQLADAQQEVLLAKAEAAATAANPSLLDKVSGAVGSAATGAGTGLGLLPIVAVVGAAGLAYWAWKDPDKGARATSSYAQGAARAAGTAAEGAAKVGGTAAKLALL